MLACLLTPILATPPTGTNPPLTSIVQAKCFDLVGWSGALRFVQMILLHKCKRFVFSWPEYRMPLPVLPVTAYLPLPMSRIAFKLWTQSIAASKTSL